MPFLLRTHAALAVLLGVWLLCVLLYLVRPRPREVVVPLLQSWAGLLQREPSLRIVPRLRQLISLALALGVSALLVRALTAAPPEVSQAELGPLLVIIDAGASMQANDVAPTRLAAAKRRVLQLLAAEPSARRVAIARWSASAELRCSETSDRAELARAIESIGPSDARTEPSAATRLAQRMFAGRSHGAVWLITDGAFLAGQPTPIALPSGIEWSQASIGRDAHNLGLRSLRVRRYPSNRNQAEARLVLENAGDRAESVELSLSADAAPIALDRLELPAHATLTRNYADLPADAQRIEAQLSSHDALVADDRAYALLPARSPTRVLLVSAGNRYLEAALLLDASLQVEREDPDRYHDAAGYDVVIFDRFVPAQPVALPSLFLAPTPNPSRPDYPLRTRAWVERPFIDRSERDHPLLHGVELRDVNIARALMLEPRPGDRVLAAGARVPLLLTGTRDRQPIVVLGFDVRDSDLPLRIAWPMLILNTLDYLHPRPPDYVAPLQVGISQAVPVESTAHEMVVVGPEHATERVPIYDRAAWLTPEHAGFYRLGSAAESSQLLAAERGPDQSISIAPAAIPGVAALALRPTRQPVIGPRWSVLVILAWLVVFAEWLCHQRRWTR